MQGKKFYICFLFIFLFIPIKNLYSQVYRHNFSPVPAVVPYTEAPQIIHPDLINSSWTTNIPNWVNLNGEGGTPAFVVSAPSGTSPTITLTFDIAPGKQLQIDSYDFWRRRTPSAPQNWSMAINGTPVGSGTIPTTGAAIGTTAVTNSITGLTGTITIVLSMSNATGTGTLWLDSFVLNGTVTTPCIAPVVSSVTPSSGPAGTTITLNGSGFMAGTSSVNINGTETTFTVVSDTKITTIVPNNAQSGPVSITTNGCPATASSFTVLSANCPQGPAPTDIYISELYDHVPGSYGIIELYNPTNSTITFNGQYVLERYGTIGDATPSYTLTLTGSIGPESTYLVRSYGTGVLGCTVAEDANMGTGINADDEFKIKKNNVVIDVARAPSYTGYTVIRQPDAIAPSATYTATDWTGISSFSCDDLDNHNAMPAAPAASITTQPDNGAVCQNGTETFTVAVNNAPGFTYQWKVLNASGNWVNVTNNTNYSGATTNTLIVSQVPAAFNENQYYVEISSGSCTLISNAVNLAVSALPAVADATATQPTCTTPTGTIIVNSPAGAGITYSINGGAFQTSATFDNLAPGSYSVTVQNAYGCTSVTGPIVINPTITNIEITTVQGCEDTASGKKYILHALPLNDSFDISTADFEWSYNGIVVGNNENTFNITDFVSQNNLDLSQYPLEFMVTVTSGGCENSTSFIVESTFCTIPKGISPNNDTMNDSFDLIGLNVSKLSIFNRYGKEVYARNNYRNEWHGQSDSNEELPTGTYYYVIERTTGTTQSGWVYLNREN